MKLDDVLIMWEADSAIDDNHLGEASTSTAKLHSKYLKILIEHKLRLTKLNSDYNMLRADKFRYYRGEMSRDELADHGWQQWQYNKPLKNEMDEFLKGDKDLTTALQRIEYLNATIYALESIMTQIKSRDWQIRNSIQWKTFLAGN